jgi:hypothetical protein
MPRSQAFLDWIAGRIGRHFLCYSPAWWNREGVFRLRYHDLVESAESTLERLVAQIGHPVRRPIAEAVEANAIGLKKPAADVWHYHYWQGRPGLWRDLIPAAEARRIAASVPEPFEVLGYECDPNESLTPEEADHNWLRLQLHSTREHLRLERHKHRRTIKDMLELQERFAQTGVALEDERRNHQATLAALDRATLWQRPVEVLRRSPGGIARRVKRVAQSFGTSEPQNLAG